MIKACTIDTTFIIAVSIVQALIYNIKYFLLYPLNFFLKALTEK